MTPTRLAQLFAAFRLAARADASMGGLPRPGIDIRRFERPRAEALEAIIHTVECPTCHATASGCTGKVAHGSLMWGLDRAMPLHRVRITAVNKLAKAVDGGGPVIP